MEFLGRLDIEAGLVAEGKAPGEPDQAEKAEDCGAPGTESRSTTATSGGFDRWTGGLKG